MEVSLIFTLPFPLPVFSLLFSQRFSLSIGHSISQAQEGFMVESKFGELIRYDNLMFSCHLPVTVTIISVTT